MTQTIKESLLEAFLTYLTGFIVAFLVLWLFQHLGCSNQHSGLHHCSLLLALFVHICGGEFLMRDCGMRGKP